MGSKGESKVTSLPRGRRQARPKVLVVEDNELNMKLFHDLLEAQGYEVLQTKDGMEALKMARQYRPDLILMDIQLPEVSGIEVTKWVKEDDDREGGCEAYSAGTVSVAHVLKTGERFLAAPA